MFMPHVRPRGLAAASIALAMILLSAALPRPAAGASTEGPARMLRSPSVSATRIAFTYASNVWVVERAGGVAHRLTSFQGQASNPRFSPDGRWVAFSGENAGNLDVYVVSADGGEPTRLTWHPGADLVQGWTADGRAVLFASGRATWAPSPAPRFWTVPATGGPEEPLALPRAHQGRISPDGSRVAYRLNTSWDEERRNYRGGQNRPVWITDLQTFDTVTPAWEGSKDMDPAWLGDRVVFISDRDGVANVWTCDAKGQQLAQLTRFTDFDVKALDAGAGTVVFEQGGQIHELDPATGREHVVPITVNGDFPWMMPHWEDVGGLITRIAISPSGKRVVLEARGEIFTLPAEKGDARNLTRSSGAADREPAWSPDGKWVAYWSDRSGEYELMIREPDGVAPPRAIAVPKPCRYYTMSWSPDSRKLLYHDTNLQVWVLDVASGRTRVVGRDPWMVPFRSLRPVWSPDSRWVAYSAHLNTLYRAIFVADAETGEAHQVTDGMADAVSPAWDADGRYLWFLAATDYGLRSQWLDMTSYDRVEHFGLYLAVLRKGDPSPFLPESDEDSGVSSQEAGGKGGNVAAQGKPPVSATEAGTPRAVTVTIDFDGLASRVVAVPGVPERPYSQLGSGQAGTVFYVESEPEAEPGRGGQLHRFKLADRKAAPFANDVAEYAVSADGRRLVYRQSPPPSPPPPPGAPPPRPVPPTLYLVDADKAAPAAGSGKLSYALRMLLDPREEFAQIFAEGWRTQRDYLYVPNMQGADWPRVRERYAPFLPWVRHRADLNYLLDQMGAEIGVGHSYVRGGDMPDLPPSTGGLLGADFAVESGRYRVTRIYDNESWNPELKAPLAAPGVDIGTGDYVLAVNGEELRAPDNLHRLLDGTANRQIVLAVNSRPVMEGARRVTVVPVASEQLLRTRAWVEASRRLVDKLSGGRLAYVYVPNTGRPGFASFNRYYFAQQDREGVVIDERYNGGGSAADYMIEVMQRRFDGYFNNVAGDRMPFTSPAAGIWGPKVMVINEMAGSGGDYLPYMFRDRKLGTLVGKRTWGGLVHTADTPPFVDGGYMIAPRGGFFSAAGRWAVENEGVAPDVDVENWPREVIAGHDPQLEHAVEIALRQLAEKPVQRMRREPPPPTWGKRP